VRAGEGDMLAETMQEGGKAGASSEGHDTKTFGV